MILPLKEASKIKWFTLRLALIRFKINVVSGKTALSELEVHIDCSQQIYTYEMFALPLGGVTVTSDAAAPLDFP